MTEPTEPGSRGDGRTVRLLWAPPTVIAVTGALTLAGLAAQWRDPAPPERVWAVIWQLVAGIGFAAAGCVLTGLRPGARPGRLMAVTAVILLAAPLLPAGGRVETADGVWVAALLVAVPAVLLTVIDPLPARRLMRGLGMVALAAGAVSAAAITAGALTTAMIAATFAVTVLLGLGWVLFELTSGDQRRRLLWLILGLTITVAGGALLSVARAAAGSWALTVAVILALVSLALPAAVAAAVLDVRSVDVRDVIHWVVVAIVMLCCVLAVYEGGDAAVHAATGAPAGDAVRFGLVVVVAVGFHPVLRWVRTSIDEMLFGGRADPVDTLGRLGSHLTASSQPQAWLETLRTALAVPGILLRRGDEVIAVAGDTEPGPTVVTALDAGPDRVGELVVALPQDRTRLPATTAAVLPLVAGPIAQLLRANQLAAELRASRGELIHALEDERRRMRRDLHDGLGPTLTGIAYNADAAANLVHTNPADAEHLVRQLRRDAGDAITEIRRIVEGIRPATLDELGLIAAIRQQTARLRAAGGIPLHVDIDAPDPLPPLPAAVEVAAYRVIVEAVTNVARHAQVDHAQIAITVHDRESIRITVADHGPDTRPWSAGVGLASMHERVEQLGGTLRIDTGGSGTAVVADIPIAAPPARCDHRGTGR